MELLKVENLSVDIFFFKGWGNSCGLWRVWLWEEHAL